MRHPLAGISIFLSLAALFLLPVMLLLPRQNIPVGDWGIIDASTFEEVYDEQAKTGQFEGKTVNVPDLSLDQLAQVLGEENSNKRIEVDLSRQRVYAYEGSSRVYEFVVSTGKWAATPKGTFSIATKVRAQTMSGGNKANSTYYYLPNVPWVMFFGNSQIPWTRGFSFHGTYWHNNFGTPMSHGCINMKIPDAQILYNWAPYGTTVNIY